jgi:hypothetical protein
VIFTQIISDYGMRKDNLLKTEGRKLGIGVEGWGKVFALLIQNTKFGD